MTDSKVLGADLYGLTIVAKRNFPTVAREYGTAKQAVLATVDLQAAAFDRPHHFGGGHGVAMQAWEQLRDEVATLLGETETSLDLSAEALMMCVNAFASADAGAAAELNRLNRVNGVPTPLGSVA